MDDGPARALRVLAVSYQLLANSSHAKWASKEK